jgi:heptosyltransferase-2
MATPALDWLRRTLPGAVIDGIARRAVAGVLAGHPALDNLFELDERRPDPAAVIRLKGFRYDVAALMTNSFGSAWFAWRLGVRLRAGFSRSLRRALLTDPLPFRAREWQTPAMQPLSRRSRVSGTGTPSHMVQYYQRIAEAAARAAGASFQPVVHTLATPMTLARDHAAEAAVEALLADAGAVSVPLVAVNPGAAYGGAKRWPLESLASAGDALAARLGGALVPTASRQESGLAEDLARRATTPLLRLGEKLDLPGLTALLRRVAVLVTNDSGGMHIAAAAGCPVVAVFGPTDWNVTYPWTGRAVVVRDSPPCAPCLLRECPIDHRCMRPVTPGRVVDAALSLLASPEHADA